MNKEVEKIRKVVEKLIDSYKKISTPREAECKAKVCKEIIKYINSLQEEPVWHDASREQPKEKKVCLIVWNAKSGASTSNLEVAIANPQERRFVTESYPHKTGRQFTIHGENTFSVYEYMDKRDYIPFSDADKWAYADDLLKEPTFDDFIQAGYEWYSDTKELKKIEQKPAWSEEDECYMSECIGAIATKDGWSFDEKRKTKHWLKSLKDRVLLQPKQKWSEDDDNDAWMNDIISKVENNLQLNKAEIDWLKFIKDQVQPKQEWSEEDSFRTETLISVIKSGGSIRPELRNEFVNWLKSLRPQNTYNPYKAVVESIAEMCKRYDKASHSGLRDFYDNVKVKSKEAQEYDKMFPQAQWKPTDEQMGCLSDAIEHYNSLGYPAPKLKKLYEQLKKL